MMLYTHLVTLFQTLHNSSSLTVGMELSLPFSHDCRQVGASPTAFGVLQKLDNVRITNPQTTT